MIGKSWKYLYSPEEQISIEQHHFPFLLHAGYWRGELVGRTKTGEPLDLEVGLRQSSRGEGHTPDIICTCRDITEKKRLDALESRRVSLLEAHTAGLLKLDQMEAVKSGNPHPEAQSMN